MCFSELCHEISQGAYQQIGGVIGQGVSWNSLSIILSPRVKNHKSYYLRSIKTESEVRCLGD
jgi:hypothetical protein